MDGEGMEINDTVHDIVATCLLQLDPVPYGTNIVT